jgi:hypothetical protein
MHPDTREVAEHMREFALNLMGKATYECTFMSMSDPYFMDGGEVSGSLRVRRPEAGLAIVGRAECKLRKGGTPIGGDPISSQG